MKENVSLDSLTNSLIDSAKINGAMLLCTDKESFQSFLVKYIANYVNLRKYANLIILKF